MACQYRDARQALLALDPTQELTPNWGKYFLPLDDHDLRAPVRDEMQPSEGRTQYSWIWITSHPPPLSSTPTATHPSNLQPPTRTTSKTDSTALDVVSQDFDRVQWAKCQARAERYEEEVELTVEEMGRTLRYFEWKRDWWLSLTPEKTKHNSPPDVQNGLRAYAYRQSHLYNELVTLFVTHWRPYLSARSLGSSWLTKYVSCVDPTSAWSSRGHRKADATKDPKPRKPRKLPADPEPLVDVDAPLNSGSDDDSEGDANDANAGDTEIDAEDMFADD